jgi:hypothetical protein
MNIQQFNAYYDKRFKYVEIESYTRHNNQHVRRFNLQQYCPVNGHHCRMLVPGTWHLNFESEDETPVDDGVCVISERRRERIENYPKHIIVCREKHSTHYYDACDTETIGRTAIFILKNRAECEDYYELSQHSIDRENEEIPEPTQLAEDFPNDPEFAKLASTEWERYNQHYRRRKNEKEFRIRHARAMKGHYVQAVGLLQERNGYEYEGFEFEELMSIEG